MQTLAGRDKKDVLGDKNHFKQICNFFNHGKPNQTKPAALEADRENYRK